MRAAFVRNRTTLLSVLIEATAYSLACPPHKWAVAAWIAPFFARTLTTYATLTPGKDEAVADLIVWPENAVSFDVCWGE